MKLYMFCYEVIFVQIQVNVLQYNTHAQALMIDEKGTKDECKSNVPARSDV